MGQPIRWDNINAPQLSGATQAMYLGGQALNNSFDVLGEALRKREVTDTANWNQQATNNTEAFYTTIAQRFNTPEKYQAGLDSGEINGLMSANGAQIDQAGARRFMDAQMGTLQARAKTAGEYQDYTRDRAEQPELDLAASEIAQGKIPEAQARLAANNFRNEAKYYQAIDAQQQLGVSRERDTKKFGFDEAEAQRKAAKAPIELDNLKADAAAKWAEPGVKAAKAYQAEAEASMKFINEQNSFGSRGGKGYNHSIPQNMANVSEVVSSHFDKDKDSASKVMEFLNKNPTTSYADPAGREKSIPVGYPPSVVQRALEMTKKAESFAGIEYGASFNEKFKTNLDAVMQSPEVRNEYLQFNQATAAFLSGAPPAAAKPNLPKPAEANPAPKVDAPTTGLTNAAKVAESTSTISTSDPQKVLEGAIAKDPKATTYWVNGERFKYQSVTDNDNNVTGNAWVKDTNPAGMFSSGNAKSRVANKYTGEDGGGDTKTPSTTTEAAKVALLKNSAGVTNAPVNATVSKALVGKIEQAAVSPTKTYVGSIPKDQGTDVSFVPSDGDTGRFRSLDPNTPVAKAIGNVGRIANIDANEIDHPGKEGQPLGQEALAFLKQAAEGKRVTVRVVDQAVRKDTDKTRNVIEMDIDGVPASVLLVRAGLARVSTKDGATGAHLDELNKAEDYARTRRLGVHSKEMRSVLAAKEFRKELDKYK